MSSVAGLSIFGAPSAIAQVIPDRTLPTNSRVNQNGNTIQIDDGTTAGSNLFHSFDQFSLSVDTTAYFNNAVDIQNIFSRVTGGSVSRINGTIRANGTANLFLLNPNGILFGPNAALNIGGSFFASTGDRILFADGTTFSASEPQASPLLTISAPIGLGFGANPGSIVNRSRVSAPGFQGAPTQIGLQVAPGQTLSLIGGDIWLDGGDLTSFGGQIELSSVGANSQVSLIPEGSSYQLGYQQARSFQDIRLTDLAEVNASGIGGGEIRVQGRNVTLTGGASINSSTLGDQRGQPITINASESLEVIGRTNIAERYEPDLAFLDILVPFRSVINSSTLGSGDAGSITINTRRLIARDGGRINTGSNFTGSGDGGDLTINASDYIEVSGWVPVGGDGDNLFLNNRLGFELNGVSSLATLTATPAGNAGNLIINTNRLLVDRGGVITSNTFTGGRGGRMTIDANDVEVRGTNPTGVVQSVITSSSTTTGQAGDLTVNADRILLRQGGVISSNVFRSGIGGTLTVNATEFIEIRGEGVRNTGLRADTNFAGAAGNLNIFTARLTVADGGRITVSGARRGTAGNLRIEADDVQLENRSSLRASTGIGTGGNVELLVLNALTLRQRSLISARAQADANGGNVTIRAGFVAAVPNENSDIIASAVDGEGGFIGINTQGIFGLVESNQDTFRSELNASSRTGVDGEIEITTLDVDPNRGLVELPTGVVDASRLIAQDCSTRGTSVAQSRGEFLITGRGGLPPSPTDPLLSDTILVDWESPIAEEMAGAIDNTSAQPAVTQTANPVIEAQGWTVGSDGKVMLIAEASHATPHAPDRVEATCPGG
ncbi:two-partner secretion domain-containing protein [Oscillatoria sp. FACHB-1407]|uniref:two-partner secretion domain-containing protein n=1 Tax=Oscillatoria sp. FACHB-1407 TaxID=2692847 RepID=UPI0016897781|nr:S-layer family protein [Oscillatoria sp. FACHB-1407]